MCLNVDFLLIYAGKRKPQLVLLDHGLYRVLDPSTRAHYAKLWKVFNSTFEVLFCPILLAFTASVISSF
jgi:hypothetical protein